MAKRKTNETKAAPKKPKRAKVATTAPVVRSGETTAQREERNGVKRPKEGGKCAEVWQALDAMRAAGVEPATKDVRDLATAKGWNVNNSTAELSAWRRWHGIARSVIKSPKNQRKSAAKVAPPATLVDTSQPAA